MPSAAVIARLTAQAVSTDSTERMRAARSKHTPTATLIVLSEDGYWQVALTALSNPATPIETVRAVLAVNDWKGSRPEIWAHPGVTEELCREAIAQRPFSPWRATGILSASACPVDLLREFSAHEVHEIRHTVAANRNTPVDVLERLVRDRNAMVRARVAANRSAPASILSPLVNDPSAYVTKAMVARGDAASALVAARATQHRSPIVRGALAKTSQDPEVLGALAWDNNQRVRRHIVRNAAAPDEAAVAAALLG